MAGELTTPATKIGLEAALGITAASTRSVYAVLLTAAATDATTLATMSEVTTPGSNGYTRQAVTFVAASGDPSRTNNSGAVSFGPFTASLTNATYVGIVSAQTGTAGDFLAYADITSTQINSGTTVTLPATTGIVVTLD